MHNSIVKNHIKKSKRALRVRNKLRGSSERPRLCVVKTNAHIIAQLIDDETGRVLGATSTFSKELKLKKNKESATALGKQIGSIAKKNQIETVIFDRGASKYHGVIAAVADGAREAGLQF